MTNWFHDLLNSKTIEPQKRLRGGSYGWADHRFPIKDGISLREALMRDICQPYPDHWNDLFDRPMRIGTSFTMKPGDDT